MTAPASMVMLPWREDIPRGGVNREQAVVTLATTLYSLNHVENIGFVQLAQAPTLAAGGNFVIGGWKSVGTAMLRERVETGVGGSIVGLSGIAEYASD